MKKSKEIILTLVAAITLSSCAPKKKNNDSIVRSSNDSVRVHHGRYNHYWYWRNGTRYVGQRTFWSKPSYNYHPNIISTKIGSTKTSSMTSKGGFGSSGKGGST